MHKKEKTDSQRAKIFTKIGREIAMCVREGGPDPASNEKLRDLIAKAKTNNVPSDNINRMIAKYAGDGDADSFESITYEGYGPCGVAVIVETLTDNRNRTAGDLRHYFDKYGGNLGASNCVSWQFDKKGVIVIEREELDEDEMMMKALDLGADDFQAGEEVFEVFTSPETFSTVREALERESVSFISADIEMVPQNFITLSAEDDIKNMRKLLDMLDDNDDVQNVYHNWENEDVE